MDAASAQDITRTYQIAEQSLGQALREFALASNLDLLFSPDLVAGKKSASLDGKFTIEEGLRTLLRGSGLEFSVSGSRVVISEGKPVTSRQATSSAPEGMNGYTRLAQARATPPVASAVSVPSEGVSDRDELQRRVELEEIVVTGSHIRGIDPVTPVKELSRSDFERGGFLDAHQALRSLPSNFGGGLTIENSITSTTGDGAENNIRTGVSSPNLRGLGSVATLTLLNGKRVPAAGLGLTVDLAMVPLVAVERMEVLADGASAIYGADAVAGVVNIITRRRFDGLEARLRYGGADGGLETGQASVFAGAQLDATSFLGGLEHYEQTELSASKREATRLTPLPYSIAGDEKRTSFFGSLTHELSPRVQLAADALYARRAGESVNTNVSGTTGYQTRDSSQYFVSAAANVAMGTSWTLDLSGTFGENTSKYPFLIVRRNGPTTFSPNHRQHQVRGAEVRASGKVFETPRGAVQAALGAAHREEELASNTSTARSERDVKSVYAELDIPLIGTADELPLLSTLRLAVAGRMDDYSDFGDVSVPRVALAWNPFRSLTLAAAYSRSFRAPSLFDAVPSYFTQYRNVIDPQSPTGMTRALVLGGSGAPVGAERAENSTLSIIFRPERIAGLELSAAYYEVEYTDRIANPDPTSGFFFNLSGAPADLIIRSPSLTTVTELLAGSISITTQAGVPADPTQVATIIDLRNTNISASRIEGLEISADYVVNLPIGELGLTADVSIIDTFADVLRPGTPARERAGNIFSPPELRGRAGVQWRKAPLSASLFWNHTDDYTDSRDAAAMRAVRAYDTFDVGLIYDFGHHGASWSRDLRILCNVTNVFDAQPPRIAPVNTGTLIEFDPTNASAIGRFISVEVVKRW